MFGFILEELDILVVYSTKHGSTAALAEKICNGVEDVPGCNARLRTVKPITSEKNNSLNLPEKGPPYADQKDLRECAGVILGSPTRFGNMSAEMKLFIDQSLENWISGDLIGKPAAFFTSTTSIHGGQESTLISMMIPLLHHGMVIVGIPYSEKNLSSTQTGGTPYGASHYSGNNQNISLSKDESILAQALGRRVSTMAKKLAK
jgi:NAD(P)H dehydrogenase (quinone)